MEMFKTRRAKTTPASTGGSFAAHTHPAPEVDLGDQQADSSGYLSPTEGLGEPTAYYLYRQDHTGRGSEFAGPYDSKEQAQAESQTIDRQPQPHVNPRPTLYVVAEYAGGIRRPSFD